MQKSKLELREELIKIFPGIQEIRNKDLRVRVIAVWSDLWEESPWDSPESCPFNPDFGDISLATHINSLWDLVKACCTIIEQHYPEKRLNRDLMAAGVFLHDASKMVEMRPGGNRVVYTDIVDKLPHAVYGAMKAAARGVDLDILNIILSHTRLTGQAPATPEAVLLHYLDYGIADVLRAFSGLPLICTTGSRFGKD